MVGEGFTKVAALNPKRKLDEADFDRPRRPGRRVAWWLLACGAVIIVVVIIVAL